LKRSVEGEYFILITDVKKRKRKPLLKSKKPPKYSVSSGEDDDVKARKKISRSIVERKGKDDGDEDFYHRRLE
jgi:hypothetical protein